MRGEQVFREDEIIEATSSEVMGVRAERAVGEVEADWDGGSNRDNFL